MTMRASVQTVYAVALLLVLALFYLHALLLLDVAGWLVRSRAGLTGNLAPNHAGKVIIVWCFFVLFVAHLLEAAAWGLFLRWRRLCVSFAEGLYYAIVSMTSLGYILPSGNYTVVNLDDGADGPIRGHQ
jgi:hypothetical protein